MKKREGWETKRRGVPGEEEEKKKEKEEFMIGRRN